MYRDVIDVHCPYMFLTTAVTPKPPHTVIKEWNDLYLLTRIPPTRVKE